VSDALVEVAVFAPLRGTFLYHPPVSVAEDVLLAGLAVRVPFGRSSRIGVILNHSAVAHDYAGKIKPIEEICSEEPLFRGDDLVLAKWASAYYHQALGEVLAAMVPTTIRRSGRPLTEKTTCWRLAETYMPGDVSPRAKRQQELIDVLSEGEQDEFALSALDFDWRRPLKELADRELVVRTLRAEQAVEKSQPTAFKAAAAPLNAEQREVVDQVVARKNEFSPTLLHGVTGSGKTNVYLSVIAETIAEGGQALVLLPEIAITQQLVDRFKACFADTVEVMHSGLGDKQRARVWTKYSRGEVRILLGTRSAVWASAIDLKCIIVDEEHDPSYKQQEGFRYNARDVAVFRASRSNIPIVLGTATPSFETFRNATSGKYSLLTLSNRAGGATLPRLKIEDIRGLKLHSGLSPHLIAAINERLAKKEQTILFLNRRGYAPVMLCHQCGELRECDRCDSKLVLHREKGLLICHQCDKRIPLKKPADCCETPEMIPLGQGTEQLAEQLHELFPAKIIRRIDRDTVRKKSELDEILQQARDGEIDILLGTQMLAKGHDFPNVTLVGVVDADARLFSLDFRAEERLAQMIIQVAGRAGRATIDGEVFVQTRQPFHWLFKTLIGGTYDEFLSLGLAEREQALLPPFSQAALIRAEASDRDLPYQFLTKIVKHLRSNFKGASIFGPIPSQLERRAGKFRAEIMFIADSHQKIAQAMSLGVEYAQSLPEKSGVRWSVDIDPQDV